MPKELKTFIDGMGSGLIVAFLAFTILANIYPRKECHQNKIVEVNSTRVQKPILYCMSPFDEVPVYSYEVLPRDPRMSESDLDNIIADEKRVFNLRDCDKEKY